MLGAHLGGTQGQGRVDRFVPGKDSGRHWRWVCFVLASDPELAQAATRLAVGDARLSNAIKLLNLNGSSPI